MAQQGGTYKLPARKDKDPSSDPSPGTEKPAIAPSDALSHDDGKIDGQQWEVIAPAEQDDGTPHSSVSSHFHLKVGWGEWKWTVLSWDVNVDAEYAKT